MDGPAPLRIRTHPSRGGVSARDGGASPRPLDEVFAALAGSAFRRRFRLREPELAYLRRRGMPAVMEHAAAFVAERLASAQPPNDGRQTPMRGHPAFLAQHATATCCRGCLAKWHAIPRGHALAAAEQAHVLAALERWLRAQLAAAPPADDDGEDASKPGDAGGTFDLFGDAD
jgi:predicted Fe-S protein YdhL (DUF1289 family)